YLLVGALGFLQRLDAVEFIEIDAQMATQVQRRWWMWRKRQFDKTELSIVVRPANLVGGGWHGFVAVLMRRDVPVIIVAADMDHKARGNFAERVSTGAGIRLTSWDEPLTVYGSTKVGSSDN